MRKEEIRTSKAGKPASLFSQGIKAGDFIFTATAPSGLDGRIISADFTAAARRDFENIKVITEAAGSSLANAVRWDGYIRDLENFSKFGKLYTEYLPKPYPILNVIQPGRPPIDCALGLAPIILAKGSKKEEIKTEKAGIPPNALFSQGLKAGNFVFTQGGPYDLDGKIIKGDFKACVKRTYENIGAVLEAADSSFENVVRTDVYLRDLDNLGIFNEVHKEYVKSPYPAFSICQPVRQILGTPISVIVTALAGGLKKEEISTSKAAKAPSGMIFSQGIKAGDYVYVTAGPFDLDGKIIKGDFKACVKRTYENIGAVLEAADSSMKNLVRTDHYLKELENFEEFNEVYGEYVPKPYPTRCVAQPARLPLNVPIEAVATAIVT